MEQNGLYSVNQNGEIRYYMTDKPINDLIQTAQNNDRAFIELGELGDRISGPDFAEIEQGSRVNYSIDFDLDNKNARIYLINGGKGGIIDPERNDKNTSMVEYRLDKVESISQRDITHNINADLSAIRGESRGNTMAEHNTKMEVSSMVSLEGGKAKAVATVLINDEFALKGIKVFESDKGLFVAMPSRKIDGEYADVCFPITSDAREQLNKVVLEQYDDMLAKGMEKYQAEKNNPPEKGLSDITVSLHRVNDEHTKATGQIVIDNCIVVSGVKVKHGTNSEGIEKDFVSMPQYQTQTGEYNQYANPITKDCYEKINNAVLNAYDKLEKTEYRGAKFSELGDKADVSTQYGLNPKYAEKVMDALDKQGIKYFAKSYEGKTSISVNNADRQTLDKTQKDVTASLKQAKEKTADKPEHKPKAKTH